MSIMADTLSTRDAESLGLVVFCNLRFLGIRLT